MDDVSTDILKALRLGSVPPTGLQQFAIGREQELAELEQQLDYVSQGRSAVKFICGDFGAGKSFFCALVRESAFDKGFAASTVVISPESPLARIGVVVGKTFDGLRLPEKRTACALSDLLEKWLLNLMKRVAALEGLDMSNPSDLSRLNTFTHAKVDEELSSVKGLDASFANAIKAYLQGRVDHDHGLTRESLGWLKGSPNLAISRRHQLGVHGELSARAALDFVKGLLCILQAVGAKGLVWVIDEVETVQHLQNPRQRDNSYESLRVLVDQVAENALPGLLLIVTGTPRLFEDPRYGIPSCQPIEDRINQIKSLEDVPQSVRQPLLKLQGFDFERLLNVGKKIREIHARALSWHPEQRLTDEHLNRLAERAVSAFGGKVEQTPRAFLREIIALCDTMHDHPNLMADECFKNDAVLIARLSAPVSRQTSPSNPPPAAR